MEHVTCSLRCYLLFYGLLLLPLCYFRCACYILVATGVKFSMMYGLIWMVVSPYINVIAVLFSCGK